MRKTKQKILVIVGPTASGKTSLAIELAGKFDGEIVSADSRQVYRELDIGTGKVTKEEMHGIPHHLIDIADPKETYTAADFVRDATNAIESIASHDKLPIVAGGTFFYIEALLGERSLAEVPPNPELREELEGRTADGLFQELETLDPARAETIDPFNKRRLIRALEIVDALGTVPKNSTPKIALYDVLMIGIETKLEELRERINMRLTETLRKGLVKETKELLASGLSRERLDEIGLEYRVVLSHLDGNIKEKEMVEELQNKVWQYAKRQRTWLRGRNDVKWVKKNEIEEINRIVKKFLTAH